MEANSSSSTPQRWRRWGRFFFATLVGACATQLGTLGLFSIYVVIRKLERSLPEFPSGLIIVGCSFVGLVVVTNLYFLKRGYFDRPIFFDHRNRLRGLSGRKISDGT